jgi:hypothetical protein
MTYEWTESSRYGAPRHFVFDGTDTVTVTCKDVLYTSFTQEPKGELSAIDPDGGPFMRIGGTLSSMSRTFRILAILSHVSNKRSFVAVFRVQECS